MSVWVNFADIYIQGMRDRSMRGGRELSGEIQPTYSSTAREQGKLVIVVLPKPSSKPVRRIKLGFKKNVFTVTVLKSSINMPR